MLNYSLYVLLTLFGGPNVERPADAQLTYDSQLGGYAQAYAEELCELGELAHSDNLRNEGHANWLRIGENVGRTATLPALMPAFVSSPTHYNVITDPDYTIFGYGACYRGDTLYVVYRFEARSN